MDFKTRGDDSFSQYGPRDNSRMTFKLHALTRNHRWIIEIKSCFAYSRGLGRNCNYIISQNLFYFAAPKSAENEAVMTN